MLDGKKDKKTPCDKCDAACCKAYDCIDITEKERGSYEHINGNLKRKANGECFYLKDNKCSIYESRPKCCRDFDCRDYDCLFVTDLGLMQHGKPDPAVSHKHQEDRYQRVHLATCQMAIHVDGGAAVKEADAMMVHILKHYSRAKEVSEQMMKKMEALSPSEASQLAESLIPVLKKQAVIAEQERNRLRTPGAKL